MEVLLTLMGVAVLWLIVKQKRRSQDHRTLEELLQLVARLERRLSAVEKAASRPQTNVEVRLPPESMDPIPPPVVHRTFPPNLAPYKNSIFPAEQSVEVPSPFASTAPPAAVDLSTQAPFNIPPPPFPTANEEQSQSWSEPLTAKHAPSLEERLGANWLNKLGITILVIGVSLFLAYQLKTLGPLGKAAVGGVLSLGILAGGLLLERRSKYRLFARAGIGGGWALTFFVTYALYHVPATRVISSQLLDLLLMMIVAVGMVWHSLRYRSQAVTSLAFLLAFVTVGISHVTLFSLVAGALLAVGLVVIAAREHWFELMFAGLIGVYVNHFLWLQRVLPDGGQPGHPFPQFAASAGLLLLYWFIFRCAYVLCVPSTNREETLASITAIVNSIGLMSLLKYQSSHPEWAFWGLLALGTAEMLFAVFAWRRRRPAFILLSSIASLLLLAAIPFRFSGSNWSLLWLLEAEMLFLVGLRLRESVFRRLGMLAGLVAAVQILMADAYPVFVFRQAYADATHHLPIAMALFTGAIMFWANAHFAPLRWAELLQSDLDAAALTVTSYAGFLTAIVGLWVFFPGAWTVIAWMVLLLLLGRTADRLASADLATQADPLGALVLIRLGVINLQLTSHWGSLSQRAVTVALAAVLFYAAMGRRTEARVLPPGYIAPAYSWSGSALLGLLVWYALRPISVATAWGMLGLVLFEIGFLLRRSYFRQQGYALLAISLARIFFVNLNSAGSSHLSSPRIYTILPLIAAYVWVYDRLQNLQDPSPVDKASHLGAVWSALIALTALAYFEVAPEWVCVAWACVVLLLILIGWRLGRPVFITQALVLLLVTGARAIGFNLLTSPSLATHFWNTRATTILATCATFCLALPVAFRVRGGEDDIPPNSRWAFVAGFFRHPEQGFFFVTLLVAILFLAVQMRAGMITVSWSALGVVIFLFALLVKERSYRLAGLGLLLLGVGKIILVDIWHATPADRYITLIVMGASLLLISFLYTRYREAILKLL